MLSTSQTALATGAAAATVAVTVWLRRKPQLGRRLPGPPGQLVVGNLADLPQPGEREWVVYGALCDKYGTSTCFYVSRLSQPLYVRADNARRSNDQARRAWPDDYHSR